MMTAAVSLVMVRDRSSISSKPDLGVVAELIERNALMLRVGLQHFAIFGMHAAGGEDVAAAGGADRHHGRFGHRGGRVVHRRVRHVHARQLADHALKFEDRGERALRDFGLIRRVRGQEFAARHDRIHHHRAVVIVDARAQKARVAIPSGGGVFRAARFEIIQNVVFTAARLRWPAAFGNERQRAGGRPGLRSSKDQWCRASRDALRLT